MVTVEKGRQIMATAALKTPSRPAPFNPSLRGYYAIYRGDRVNHCPGCGRTHWLVGRMLAECGFCATALPLAPTSARTYLEVEA